MSNERPRNPEEDSFLQQIEGGTVLFKYRVSRTPGNKVLVVEVELKQINRNVSDLSVEIFLTNTGKILYLIPTEAPNLQTRTAALPIRYLPNSQAVSQEIEVLSSTSFFPKPSFTEKVEDSSIPITNIFNNSARLILPFSQNLRTGFSYENTMKITIRYQVPKKGRGIGKVTKSITFEVK